MDGQGNTKFGAHLERQLANLKLISRLLTHELHSQVGAKTLTLSREEVMEIKTTIDLFIEDASLRPGATPTIRAADVPVVNPRNN